MIQINKSDILISVEMVIFIEPAFLACYKYFQLITLFSVCDLHNKMRCPCIIHDYNGETMER